MKVKEIIQLIQDDGWVFDRQKVDLLFTNIQTKTM